MLDGQPAYGNVAGSYLYSETGFKIDFGPYSDKTRLLPFNRIQSSVVTGLLTRHNMLRIYLYIMGLIDSPFCRRCAAEKGS